MKIKEIFLEYNIQNLLSLFQEKYKEIKDKDPSNEYETLNQFINSIEDPLRQQNKFQFIDPYMKWIVQRYVTGKLNKYEDVVSKVIPGLLKYDSLKRKNKLKSEHKDINQIKDINHLLDILDEYKEEETLSGKEKEKEIEENFYRTGEAILLHNDPEFKVVVPKSGRASCFFGRNTRWCTAATQGKNYFKEYNKKGDLYIIIVKKENKRFQFHFNTKQFMDEMDNEIDFFHFYENYPKIYKFFSKIAKQKKSIYFMDPKNISQEEFLKKIKKLKNYDYIKLFLENNQKWLDNEEFIYKFLISLDDQYNFENVLFYLINKNKISNELMEKIIFKNPFPLFYSFFRNNLDFYMEKFPFLKSEEFYIKLINNISKNPFTDISNILFIPKIAPLLGKKFFDSIKNTEIEKRLFNNILLKIRIYEDNLDLKKYRYFISFILENLKKNINDVFFNQPKNLHNILILLKKIKETNDVFLNKKISDVPILDIMNKLMDSNFFTNMYHFFTYLINNNYIEIFNEEIKKELEKNPENIFGYIFGKSNPKDFYKIFNEKTNDSLYFLELGLKKNFISEEYVMKCFFSVLNDKHNINYFINNFISKKNNKIPNLYNIFFSDNFMKILKKKIES